MNPDDRQLSHGGGEPNSSSLGSSHSAQQREAAANVVRSSLDSIYNQSSEQEEHNPYLRQHSATPTTAEEQWKAYHTAWQNYYQQYYQSYYHQQHQAQATNHHASHDAQHKAYFDENSQPVDDSEILTKDEALLNLRQRLLSKVTASAKKVRKSRHFVPILASLIVVFAFLFIQFNKTLVGTVMAYVAPGSIDPQNIIIDPTNTVAVTKESRLIIPKINVDVPVNYDVGNDYDSQMEAMKNGLAHFAIPGASAHPGEIGNTVLAGHSSNDLFDTGDYKFIFAQLEKMKIGDTFYANYKGVRYSYVVTDIKVVKPTDINSVVYNGDKPIMTLLTCTPLGTALNRLLVIGEQVTPDPSTASKPAANNKANKAAQLSGANAPSLFERLFGAR